MSPPPRIRRKRVFWILTTSLCVLSGSGILLWSTTVVVMESGWIQKSTTSTETEQNKVEQSSKKASKFPSTSPRVTVSPSSAPPKFVPTAATTSLLPTLASSSATQTPIPVYLWPNVNQSNFDDNTLGYSTYSFEYKHFVIEGIDRSQNLERIYDASYSHPKLIWMTDLFQGKRPSKWCAALTSAVKDAQKSSTTSSTPWPLYILDWNDDPKLPWTYQHCDELYELLGRHNVYYWKRSMVRGRSWNESTRSINPGTIDSTFSWNYSDWSAAPIQHLSYGVRTDILCAMQEIIQRDYADLLSSHDSSGSIKDWDLSSLLPRPFDVAHFWPAPEQQTSATQVNRGGSSSNNSQLRDEVSRAIYSWNQTHSNATGFAGLTGSAKEQGRVEAQEDYARALLEYKIVVVAQKDEWEGHYRLMEALSSGALVMTDRMLVPPKGFQDGTSIVIYDNATDLLNKIEHYLWSVSTERREAIAREGRRIAMTRHRSWHIMERIIHGKALSAA